MTSPIHLRRNFLSRYGRDIGSLFRNDARSWFLNRTLRDIRQIIWSLLRRNLHGLLRVLWVIGHHHLLSGCPTGGSAGMFREVAA